MNNKILIISAIAWAIIAYNSYQIGASAARCDQIIAEIHQTIAQEQGYE